MIEWDLDYNSKPKEFKEALLGKFLETLEECEFVYLLQKYQGQGSNDKPRLRKSLKNLRGKHSTPTL